MAEGGDRPVAARIAEPAGGPRRRRSGVVGIGDGQFGGDEDRLAGGLAQLVPPPWRSARPGVRGTRRSGPDRGRGRSGLRASSAPGSTGCRGRGRPRHRRRVAATSPAPRESCHASHRRRSQSGCCGSTAAAAAVDRSRRSSGSAISSRSGRGDRVGRHHAPTAGGRQHDHVGTPGSGCVAKVAAASNASSTSPLG